MDIGSRVVEISLTVNIVGFPPFEIRFESKVEDFGGYQMIHSAIQSKQGILGRLDTSEPGKLINRFSTLSFFHSFNSSML